MATFPRVGAYALVFVALVPLGVATCGRPPLQRIALGWIAGLTFYLLGWRWLLPTIATLQEWPLLAALPFFLLVAGYHALQLALFALLLSTGARVVAAPLFLAAWWVVLERSFPRVIPWNLGDALAQSALLRQPADLVGAYGLSFFIVLINMLLLESIRANATRSGRAGRLLLVLTLIAAAAVYGVRARSSLTRPDAGAGPSVRVSIAQSNVAPAGRDRVAANAAAWETYASLTQLALPQMVAGVGEDLRLYVWPETVLRVYLADDGVYRPRIERLVEGLRAPLLLGALDRHADGYAELNSAYLFTPGRNAATPRPQIYRKRRLVPFGEHISPALIDSTAWRTTGNFVAGGAGEASHLLLAP